MWRHSRGSRGATACGSCPSAQASNALQPCGSLCARTTKSTTPGLIHRPGNEFKPKLRHIVYTVPYDAHITDDQETSAFPQACSNDNVLDSFSDVDVLQTGELL